MINNTKTVFQLFVIVLLLTCGSIKSKAQDYKYFIAYKSGIGKGIIFKRLLPNETAFAGQLIFKDGGFSVTSYRMFHKPVFTNRSYNFFLYYGYGAHVRYYREKKINNPFTPFSPTRKIKGDYLGIGPDGIIGLEYRFLKYPFVLAADMGPNFEYGGANFFRVNIDQISVSVAYTF